jgi:hypothetical protein
MLVGGAEKKTSTPTFTELELTRQGAIVRAVGWLPSLDGVYYHLNPFRRCYEPRDHRSPDSSGPQEPVLVTQTLRGSVSRLRK